MTKLGQDAASEVRMALIEATKETDCGELLTSNCSFCLTSHYLLCLIKQCWDYLKE